MSDHRITEWQLRNSLWLGFPLRFVLFVVLHIPTTALFAVWVFAQGCWYDGVREAGKDTRYWTADFWRDNWRWTKDPRMCA